MKKFDEINIKHVLFFYTGMAAVGLIWIFCAGFSVDFFGSKGMLETYLLATIIFAISLGLSIRYKWAEELEKLFATLLTQLNLQSIFLLALSSSVAEEILFRGAIQNQFGLVIASILFGAIHVPIQRKMRPWTLLAMIMGFVLGGLYIYAGHLLAPIALHFLVNFLNIWAINQKYKLH